MSNVLVMDPIAANQTRPEKRLRRLSLALVFLFTVLLACAIAWAIGAVIVSVFFADHVLVGTTGAELTFPKPPSVTPGTVQFSDQSWITRIAGMVDVEIAMAPVVMILLHLRGLFRLYASGVVFARANAVRLQRIGIWLIAYPFAKLAAGTLFRSLGGTDHAWFSATLIHALLLGAVVFVIAQVMEMGHEIETERSEFV